MITGRQIRAARALLDMSQDDLAHAAGLTKQGISKIEDGSVQPRVGTLGDITRVFDEKGLEFTENQGVRFKPSGLNVYEGEGSTRALLDDVYETLRDTGGEVLIAGVNEDLAIQDLDESFLNAHIERLNKSKITERMLIRKGDTKLTVAPECYHCVDADYFSPFPLYIYGPKLALVSWAPRRRCVIIHDENFAESTRRLFNFVWDRTDPPKIETRE